MKFVFCVKMHALNQFTQKPKLMGEEGNAFILQHFGMGFLGNSKVNLAY
jgi:hypothetical protein